MFKKIVLALFIILGVSFAHAVEDESMYGKVYFSSYVANAVVGSTSPIMMTFNAPGPGKRNCITDVSISNTNFPTNWSFFILDNQRNTTNYAITVTTNPFIEDWYRGNPLCLSPGNTTYIYISSGNYSINMSGYVK